MKNIFSFFFLLSIAASLTGCTTMTSHADWDTSATFSNLQTYAWVSDQQPPTGNPRIDNNTLLDDRVRQAIDNTLASKGYTQVAKAPDFWVSYQAAVEAKLDAMTIPSHGYSSPYVTPYGGVQYNYSGAWSTGTTSITQYDEGSLIIDIADAKTNRLIWRGTVSDVLNPSRAPEKRKQMIDKAVAKAFSKFPPQPNK